MKNSRQLFSPSLSRPYKYTILESHILEEEEEDMIDYYFHVKHNTTLIVILLFIKLKT